MLRWSTGREVGGARASGSVSMYERASLIGFYVRPLGRCVAVIMLRQGQGPTEVNGGGRMSR